MVMISFLLGIVLVFVFAVLELPLTLTVVISVCFVCLLCAVAL